MVRFVVCIDDLDRHTDGKSVKILEAVQLRFNETAPPTSSSAGLFTEHGGWQVFCAKVTCRWLRASWGCRSSRQACCTAASRETPVEEGCACRHADHCQAPSGGASDEATSAGFWTRLARVCVNPADPVDAQPLTLTDVEDEFDSATRKAPPFMSVFVRTPRPRPPCGQPLVCVPIAVG